jgi:hypothetical protein
MMKSDELPNFSEEDYQCCAKWHRGGGTSRGGKFLGMIKVIDRLKPAGAALHGRTASTSSGSTILGKSLAYLLHVSPTCFAQNRHPDTFPHMSPVSVIWAIGGSRRGGCYGGVYSSLPRLQRGASPGAAV